MLRQPLVRRLSLSLLLVLVGHARGQGTVDYEHDPIRYSAAQADNPLARLQARLDKGKVRLDFDPARGYLPALLRALQVPASSQVLVFSKTSLQADKIGPRTPRAIYFNDTVHVGYVQGGVLEIATADPRLGMVFYQLDETAQAKPQFVRQTNRCLTCHGAVRTRGVPGLLVRSVFPDANGQPIVAAGSYRTDHTSPFAERWGGWYVTGTHGGQKHLGNLVLQTARKPKTIENEAGQNVTDLTPRLDLKPYLTPHSDLVALMVLEHQADAHNYLTRANFETRLALHAEAVAHPSGEARRRIQSAGEALVKYLLFSREAKLTAPVRGTSPFAREFAARRPWDKQGRSLRDFDLERRLFKYPCSYLIYSESFEALPRELKDYVSRRLFDVLSGRDTGPDFIHLTAQDRQVILSILRETKPELPDYWR